MIILVVNLVIWLLFLVVFEDEIFKGVSVKDVFFFYGFYLMDCFLKGSGESGSCGGQLA